MATIHLLEAEKQQNIGGVLLTFAPDYAMQLTWSGSGPSNDPQETGQALAIAACERLLKADRLDLLNSTNWASLAAGCAELFRQWKAARGA